MYRVMKTFICRGCVNPVIGAGCTSVDIGVNANLELGDKFYYLGDMKTHRHIDHTTSRYAQQQAVNLHSITAEHTSKSLFTEHKHQANS